jgi:hypothetical protein
MEELDSQQTNQPVRKTYSTPHLQVYGNMREVTQAVGKHGGSDSGKGTTMNTQP